MTHSLHNIKIYMGPQETGGPDDLKHVIVDFIDGAEKHLDIAVQELDSPDIAEAIIRARQRKVAVNLVVENDYLTVGRALTHPFEPGGQHEENRQLHDAILRSHIAVKSDFNPKIFHQKFIIRDRASLLTGSTNFTVTGTSKNLNHIVVVHDEEVAKIYGREFAEINKGHFGKLNEGHDPVPQIVEVSEIPIKILFAPDHNPEMEIMKQMMKAQKKIDFAIFTFAQSSGIDDTMIGLRKAGLAITGAMDGNQAGQKWAATHPIYKAGVELYTIPKQERVGKLHHKLMVIDEQVIIAGSFNYTNPANRLNDENIIILGSLSTENRESIDKQKRLAAYAKHEIDRIIEEYGERVR